MFTLDSRCGDLCSAWNYFVFPWCGCSICRLGFGAWSIPANQKPNLKYQQLLHFYCQIDSVGSFRLKSIIIYFPSAPHGRITCELSVSLFCLKIRGASILPAVSRLRRLLTLVEYASPTEKIGRTACPILSLCPEVSMLVLPNAHNFRHELRVIEINRLGVIFTWISAE